MFPYPVPRPGIPEAELPHLRYEGRLVYGGESPHTRGGIEIIPWSAIPGSGWEG